MKPTLRNIIVKLPKWQRERLRETSTGLLIPHLEGKFQHNASHGTVVQVSDNCKIARIGDEVFFPNLTIKQALQNSDLDPTVYEKHGSGVPVYYHIEDGEHYLIMPENRIYDELIDLNGTTIHNTTFSGVITLIRSGEIVCCNGYHLMEQAHEDEEIVDGVKGRTLKSGIFAVITTEKEEKNKRYRITYAPEDSEVVVGDIVYTQPHCDLHLEGEYNYPQLPSGTFYVEQQFLLAVEARQTPSTYRRPLLA